MIKLITVHLFRKAPPLVINLDGYGNFTEMTLDSEDGTCPESHFRCPGTYTYCLPVYLK